MKLGTVIGSVWATRKVACLQGQTFLIVSSDDGEIIAADQVGAGAGDTVLVALGGAAARYCMETPVDAVVIAIIDSNRH